MDMQNYADDDSRDDDPAESEMDQDIGREQAEETPCPYCGAMIYEQAERCPACGKYISEEDQSTPKVNWVFVAVVLTILGIIIVWIMGGR
jgi:hypothetical protein